jgi:uncharacterized lipoprotein YehR (DUF1307 family)
MEAIDKLRKMVDFFNEQMESENSSFKSIKGLEKAYDYAMKNNLEYIDYDYLYEPTEEFTHLNNLAKYKKL